MSGHVLLNQCCSLLTRSNHRICGYNKQRNFLQRISTTTPGDSIPLLYPEGMLFPSISYRMVPNDGSIAGSIPSALLNGQQNLYGFALIYDHIQSRLASPSYATSTNLSYVSFCYNIPTNLTLNHQDARLVLNRGLTVDETSKHKIGIRCKGESVLSQSIDLKKIKTSLLFSKNHKMDYFLTFTSNQNNFLASER